MGEDLWKGVLRWKGGKVKWWKGALLFYNLSRMFLKRLDPGSLPGMTRFLVWGWFVSWAAEVRSAEATELPVGRDLRSLWQTDFATPIRTRLSVMTQ